MGSLRDEVRFYSAELSGGIAWVLVWKKGRSWRVLPTEVERDEGSGFPRHRPASWSATDEDRELMAEALRDDPNACLLNSYYCNLGDPDCMTIESLYEAVRWQHDMGGNVADILDELQPQGDDDLASEMADLTGIPCPVISYGMEVLPA